MTRVVWGVAAIASGALKRQCFRNSDFVLPEHTGNFTVTVSLGGKMKEQFGQRSVLNTPRKGSHQERYISHLLYEPRNRKQMLPAESDPGSQARSYSDCRSFRALPISFPA